MDTQDVVDSLEGTVERLKVLGADGGEAALTDNVAEVRQLCISVEEILRHQQKDKVSFWGERRDYWHYLSEVVSKMKSLDGCVKRVQGLPQLTTGQGKGRALIRECLTEQLLADCIQNSLSNSKRTKEWYHPNAILLTESFSERVLNVLYDLSAVNFDLPSEGIDLDETWPSFVLKSFGSENGPSEGQNAMSPLLKVLGVSTRTQVAKVADKDKPKVSLLERAVEEEPTEIFIRHEIPFDLELTGSLIAEIGGALTACGTESDHAFFHPPTQLPQLMVVKMDDITSCLDLLRGYIVSWTRNISKSGSKLVEENRTLKDKQADLEMQLQETIQESENSEAGLIDQLQTTREELKSYSSEVQRLLEDNQQLTQELGETRDKMGELETTNFDLEEQLVRCSPSESEERVRERAYTVMESSLQEKDEELIDASRKLGEVTLQNQQLLRDLNDVRTSLDNQSIIHEAHRRSEVNVKQLQEEAKSHEGVLSRLRAECVETQSRNQSLTEELQELRTNMERKLEERVGELALVTQERDEVKQELDRAKLELDRVEQELNHLKQEHDRVEQERDSIRVEQNKMKVELEAAGSMVEDATTSLKFKLSSQNIELQQAKEHSSKKDRHLAELRHQVTNLESQLGEMTERCDAAEEQLEEVKVELQDVESVLHNNQDEMGSLHQQLEEKTLSRDQERVSMLKRQSEWDSVKDQLSAEKTDLKRQVERLRNENDEIRRALQKLLEQKVTLWQHADDLEQEQIALGTWLESKDITECMNCNLTFTMFTRKHHCRSCGRVFCTKCCDKKLQLAVSKDPARVCDSCYKRILQKRMPFASSVINNAIDTDSLSKPHPIPGDPQSNQGPASQGGSPSPLRRSRVSSNSLNIERTVDLSGNSLQAKLLVQNQESELDSHPENSPQLSSQNSLTSTLRVKSKTEIADGGGPGDPPPGDPLEIRPSSYRSINSMEYSVDPEIKRREAEKAKEEGESLCIMEDTDYCLSSVQGETIDESYYLIETQPQEASFPMGLEEHGSIRLDVGALASKLATLEEDEQINSASSAEKRRMSTGSSKVGYPHMTEVMLEGGASHTVDVTIERHGTAIAWEFSTEPKGIAFGIGYRESKKTTREDEVLPLKRCVSHKATLTGEYNAQKKGVYVLKFSNCHSKYSGRKLMFKVWTRPPS